MRLLILFLSFTFALNIAMGQNTYTKASDSDPKAKAILDKVKLVYNGYKSMEVNFELDLELPNKAKETQKGSFIQSGIKYLAKTNKQEIYSDGKATWVYLKTQKEVQITDVSDSPDAAFMSPKQVISLYDKGEYVYVIVDERKVGAQSFVDIEFKPINRRAEYSKLRMTIDKKSNKLVSLRVFSKDGSRFTLRMNDLVPNKKYDPGIFVFNPKTAPGVHVEDLRMD